MEMISVPSIIAIVFAIDMLLKTTLKKYTAFLNFIPLISSVLGAVLGIVAFYAIPAIMPTDNVFHAILFGLFSGLSATGSENLVLQLKEFTNSKKDKIYDTTEIQNNDKVDNVQEEVTEVKIANENELSNTTTEKK